MKKLLLTLLIGFNLFASDAELAAKIHLSIAKECTKKQNPKIYLHGDIKELRHNSTITTTLKCEEADFVIASTIQNLPDSCRGKLLFATRYKVFKKHPEVFGAFFWQKGRPNIIFDALSLKEHNLTLHPSFNKYIE
ncbi:MAG: hypothetical protein U9Q62_07520 [Campylobacterota bacterium]|nr:hypothetical protein [Campylobacterota bacterium]